MKFHVVTGMPRSGSTLLCNILNQNPEFYASSTSSLPAILNGMSKAISNDPVTKAKLDQDETETRITTTLLGTIYNWYISYKDKVVFDKSRGWTHHALMLNKLIPDAKMIVCVRDLREVFASTEKQNAKTAHIFTSENMFQRADSFFSPEGLIGAPLRGVEDCLRRRLPQMMIVEYHKLCNEPDKTLREIYEFIGVDYFEHDFEHVVNVAEDVDGMYMNKFPHNASGRVEPNNSNWGEWVSLDIAKKIMELGQYYNRRLGYE